MAAGIKHLVLRLFWTLFLQNFFWSGITAAEWYTGTCSSNEECIAMVRSRYPSGRGTGVDLCGCYAASSADPFDECEGNEVSCVVARCMNTCAGMEAQCLSSPDADGTKACDLWPMPAQSTKPTSSSTASLSKAPAAEASGANIYVGDHTQSVIVGDSAAIATVSPQPNSTSFMCTVTEECTATVRSRYPSQSSIGVDLCQCYAASSIDPFNECEGESDATCKIAKCMNACAGVEAKCLLSSDSMGGSNVCSLQPISAQAGGPSASPAQEPITATLVTFGPKTSTTAPSLTNKGTDGPTAPTQVINSTNENNLSTSNFGTCTADKDCTAAVRSRYPSESKNGVDLCDCYAASSIDPFDECEGETDTTCMIAKCMNSCAGLEAYCNATKSCDLRPISQSQWNLGDKQSTSEEGDLLESAGNLLRTSLSNLVWITAFSVSYIFEAV